MAVTTDEQHQAVGDFSIDIDHNPAIYAELVDESKRPRKVHVLIYDEDDTLIYVGVLLRVTGDKKGLTVGGCGMLWHLGQGDRGPMIIEREYISGNNKLSNGSFDLGAKYWREPSEESHWLIGVGSASNVGGPLGDATTGDDTLELDEKFAARPGQSFQAIAEQVHGLGRAKIRTIYTGTFNPPNLLGNPGFESGPGVNWTNGPYVAVVADGGARTGAYAMRVSTIPKPELISNGDFSAGSAGWTVGPTMQISGGALTLNPNIQPELMSDPGFETGGGWVDQIGPPTAPMSDDIDIVNKPAEAKTGSYVMEVGPITQHGVFMNADLGSGLDNWYPSSNIATPDTGLFYSDPGGGMDGSDAATTDGAAFPTRTLRYLRADSANGTVGVQAYDVKPGERYLYEVYVRAAPATDGSAYVSLHIPHPTVANQERWYTSHQLDGPKVSDDVFRRLSIDLSIPPNRFKIDALCEVHDCTTGYWAFDSIFLTRTRGNRAEIRYATPLAVAAHTTYRVAADVRSSSALQVGTVRLGAVLTGAGKPDIVVDVSKGDTDFDWTRTTVDVRPQDGYTAAFPFVAGLDIIGAPVYIDLFTFTRVDNNRDWTHHDAVSVTQDQNYLLSADVTCLGATRGDVTVGVTLSGPDVANEDIEIGQGIDDDGIVKSISIDVVPQEGYTTAALYVRSTDIEGGSFTVTNVKLTKTDNNFDTSTGTAFNLTPERDYLWSAVVRSGPNLLRGDAKLALRLLRPGFPDQIIESAPIGFTEGEWYTLDFAFTPPSGYAEAIPSIIGTDVEGDSIWIDDNDLRDQDKTTVVFDAATDNPIRVSPFVNSTAPAGTEFVHVAVIVEADSANWTLDGVSLKRTGEPLATGNSIVTDILKDPVTGVTLSLTAGTLSANNVIPYDIMIRNTTNRALLEHLCSVVADPPLEFKVDVDRTLDVGPAATVFADRTNIILLPEDMDVQDLSNAEADVTDRATVIHLIGNERKTVSGQFTRIEAFSTVPGAPEGDWHNNPISRTTTVNAGTVDHQGYAQAYADALAAKEANPAISVTAALTGVNTRPFFDVGDWIYAYEPDAGLADETRPPVTIKGKTVFPRKVRVWGRNKNLGPTHRIEIRRTDATTFNLADLTTIGFEGGDSTTLTLGDRFNDWEADEQGGDESTQYLMDIARRPQ